MALHIFQTKQVLPMSLQEAWDFFSSPANLKEITPDHLGFKITSKYHGEKMYPGQIISYIVKPVLGIPLEWVTEISHVEEGKFFVDEQRFGPYSFWHHQHFFREVNGGVEMTDIVHYKVPLGILGDIANAIFVKHQLKQIFDFRYQKLEQVFGKVAAAVAY
jgi:ligand-binding SRPBCC domain-containing protein